MYERGVVRLQLREMCIIGIEDFHARWNVEDICVLLSPRYFLTSMLRNQLGNKQLISWLLLSFAISAKIEVHGRSESVNPDHALFFVEPRTQRQVWSLLVTNVLKKAACRVVRLLRPCRNHLNGSNCDLALVFCRYKSLCICLLPLDGNVHTRQRRIFVEESWYGGRIVEDPNIGIVARNLYFVADCYASRTIHLNTQRQGLPFRHNYSIGVRYELESCLGRVRLRRRGQRTTPSPRTP
jgi:hypothetical protein